MWSCPMQGPHIPCTRTHVPFPLLKLYQRIILSPRQLCLFCNKVSFYGEELSAPRPTPKLEDHPLVGCPWLLIQNIHSYPLYQRPFLRLRPEDTPCCGGRGTHLAVFCHATHSWVWIMYVIFHVTGRTFVIYDAMVISRMAWMYWKLNLLHAVRRVWQIPMMVMMSLLTLN